MKILDMPEFKASDLIETDVSAMAEMSKALKRRWGVGSIYISTDDTSPATLRLERTATPT